MDEESAQVFIPSRERCFIRRIESENSSLSYGRAMLFINDFIRDDIFKNTKQAISDFIANE